MKSISFTTIAEQNRELGTQIAAQCQIGDWLEVDIRMGIDSSLLQGRTLDWLKARVLTTTIRELVALRDQIDPDMTDSDR